MRTTIPKLLAAGLLLALSAGLGCDSKETATTGGNANGDAGGKTYTIGMSQANLAEPYRVQMNKDVRDAVAKHPDLKLIEKDAQKDSNKQRAQVEEFVSQGVDLIIISPNEPDPLTLPVKRAMEAGIPVIVLDRQLRGGDYTTFIGADNEQIGKAAGEWIVKTLGGKGKVVELEGMMSTDPAQKRHNGFREAIKGSDVDVVIATDMQWDQSRAKGEMESALSREGKIDLVYAHNDPGAYGAYLAAKAAGREKDMKFVGIDGLPDEGVAYVKQGILDATFQYPTGGDKAVEVALQILKGEDVEKEITLGSRLFTPENVNSGGEALPAPAAKE